MGGADTFGPADLAGIRCGEGVNSIFIEVGATWCPACNARITEVGRMADHWRRNGAVWIFIISDVPSAAMADAHVSRQGASFGYRTNDADNSEGSMTVAEAPLFSTIPWTAAIRASDMQMVYEDSRTHFDPATVAEELARE